MERIGHLERDFYFCEADSTIQKHVWIFKAIFEIARYNLKYY